VSELAALLGEAIGRAAAGAGLRRRTLAAAALRNRDRPAPPRPLRTQRLLALQYPVVGFLEAAGILAVLLIGAARIQSGDLNGQGFSSYVAALLMLIDPISHLTTNFNELQQGQASLKRPPADRAPKRWSHRIAPQAQAPRAGGR
jgi:ATP-binding cassette subfamily B protein